MLRRVSFEAEDEEQTEVIDPVELAGPAPVSPPQDVVSRDASLLHIADLPPPSPLG